MRRTLCIDIGAGTMDVLWFDTESVFHYKTVGPAALETIIATGPKRRIIRGSHLPVVFGAPMGDNMLTGCVGLLEALRLKKGLPPLAMA